jgi:hypothetical protein
MDVGILNLLHYLVYLLLGEINMRGGLILGLEQTRLLSHHSVGRRLYFLLRDYCLVRLNVYRSLLIALGLQVLLHELGIVHLSWLRHQLF